MVRRAKSLPAVCLTVAMLNAISCSTTSASTGGTAPAADANPKLVYDVRDLVIPQPPSDVPFITLPDLAVALKEATDGEVWNRPGWGIEPHAEGYLTVDASDNMHKKVAMVLSDLRRFAVAKQ